jgi:hypothetical protein
VVVAALRGGNRVSSNDTAFEQSAAARTAHRGNSLTLQVTLTKAKG